MHGFGAIQETMAAIAANPSLMMFVILLDMVTALGVVFLGCMLFLQLRSESEPVAFVAFAFYVVEAVLLAVSRGDAFSLLQLSRAFESAAPSVELVTTARIALESMEFVGTTLHMLVFTSGAILFYALLVRTRILPRPVSIYGLVTVVPLLIATIVQTFGIQVPFVVYAPYVPFELVAGVWLLVAPAADR